MTPEQALQSQIDAQKAKDAMEFLAPYLDRMQQAHINTLNQIIMEAPHKKDVIVAHSQATRNFGILRGMIEHTIAEGRQAEHYQKEVGRYSSLNDTERSFLGFTIVK